MDKQTKIELEAAAFRQLQTHLMQNRKDVQNIDLMNLAGFCRNCLSTWLHEESENSGIKISKEDAEEQIYKMPKVEWKEKYQK